MKMNKTTLAMMIASCFGSGVAIADDETKVLSPVVVTATRVEQDSFDLPMSIDKIEKENIQDAQARVSLSESLVRVPGLTAQYRNQNSSDLSISSRGFGARSSFGVRGIRLYVDGIPLTTPDGTGTPGNVDLGSIGSIEVMRGPFSALYGSSSGGVIQLFTEVPTGRPTVGVDYYTGNFATHRTEVRAAGTQGGLNYLLTTSDFASNGFRTQSASEKQQATARLGVTLSEDSKLTTIINWFDQNAQDPGGLRKAGGTASNPSAFQGYPYYNPTGATKGAITFNAHGEKSNTQIGFNFEKVLDAHNQLNLITYAGNRTSDGYIAVPDVPRYDTGRLSQIDRDFYGVDLQATNRGSWQNRPYTLVYGISAGYMKDRRKDSYQVRDSSTGIYSMTDENWAASSEYNRNEVQKANNFDQYMQGTYALAERWDLHAGIRHSNVRMSIKDYQNTNDGNMSYSATTPVAGIVFKATPTLNFYANVGKGFETPTMIESTYGSATDATGTNRTLKPSTSTNIEVGTKWMVSDNTRVNAAAFAVTTNDEIVIGEQGDYTVYTNASRTKRNGAELSAEHRFNNYFSTYVAYTFLDATFDKAFSYDTERNGDAYTVNVKKGYYIPGTYRQQAYAELAFRHQPTGFASAIEARYNSKVFVEDENDGTAPSYVVVNLRASLQQTTGKWRFTEYARIENILDKEYIGSVKLNDSNLRYYESSPGRNYIVGVKANYMF